MEDEENKLKSDFRNFLWAIWKFLGLPAPTPVQYDIAVYLQHGPRRSVIQAFRGVGKSWITAAYVCWLLYKDPDHKILVVSANATKASEFTTFVLRLIREIEILQHLAPRFDQRQSSISFDVNGAKPSQSPSVKSIGITGQITGGRANTIVPDDIEIPHNSDTPGKRDKLLEQVKEFDAVLLPGGSVKYLGTPQTESTIYSVLRDRGYTLRVWPARYPESSDKYFHELAPIVSKGMIDHVGEPTDPARFDNEDLAQRELSYGKSGFALQFMLDTDLSDVERHPLKLADLVVLGLDPYRGPANLAWASSPDLVWNDLPMVGLLGDRFHRPAWTTEDYAEYETCIMAVDPSGRGKDETGYAVLKQLHGRIFLVANGGFYGGGYDEDTLERLMTIAKRYGVQKIIAEPNFGGGMFTTLLQGAANRHYGCMVEDAKWSNVQKEARIIDTLEPVMLQHRLIVTPDVIENDYKIDPKYGDRGPLYRLFYQMTRITRDRGSLGQDDRLDALALGVAHLMEHIARDAEQATLEHRAAEEDKMIEKFLKHSLGRDSPGNTRRLTSSISRRVSST